MECDAVVIWKITAKQNWDVFPLTSSYNHMTTHKCFNNHSGLPLSFFNLAYIRQGSIESNAKWSSNRTPADYFSAYVYASHFILAAIVCRDI